MSPTPDQVNTALIGVASLAVAGLSFIYASRAQAATRRAETARTRTAEVAVDAAAYQRARELYESGIKSLSEQNAFLHAQLTDLQAEADRFRQAGRLMAERIAQLERDVATTTESRIAGLEHRSPPAGAE